MENGATTLYWPRSSALPKGSDFPPPEFSAPPPGTEQFDRLLLIRLFRATAFRSSTPPSAIHPIETPYISSRWRRCGPTPMPLRTRRANVSTRPSRSYGWGGCQKRDRDECRRLAATFASYDKTQTMKPSCALTRGSAAPFTSRSSPLMAAVRMSAGAPTNAIWQREHPKSKQRTSQR
jgi:hypothetical protein